MQKANLIGKQTKSAKYEGETGFDYQKVNDDEIVKGKWLNQLDRDQIDPKRQDFLRPLEKGIEPGSDLDLDNLDNIKYISHSIGEDGQMVRKIVYNNEEIDVGHKVVPEPTVQVQQELLSYTLQTEANEEAEGSN